jgi:type IV fimbrial biogenesis protein FimT
MLILSQKQQGVTLIELMVAIAILAILLTLGIPNFTVWMQNTQIRTATESIQNGLQLARAEAVRRNEPVSFILGTGTSWTVQTVAAGTVIQSRASSEGSVNVTVTVTGGNTATFNELGRLYNPATAPTRIDLKSSILGNQGRNLRIDITAGGQIRSCDPMFTDSNDPRYCQP